MVADRLQERSRSAFSGTQTRRQDFQFSPLPPLKSSMKLLDQAHRSRPFVVGRRLRRPDPVSAELSQHRPEGNNQSDAGLVAATFRVRARATTQSVRNDPAKNRKLSSVNPGLPVHLENRAAPELPYSADPFR